MTAGMVASNVRSRIASFEAKNEYVRQAPLSPTTSEPDGRSPEQLSPRQEPSLAPSLPNTTAVTASNIAAVQQQQQQQTSPERPPSHTSMASQSRKHRLSMANSRDFRKLLPSTTETTTKDSAAEAVRSMKRALPVRRQLVPEPRTTIPAATVPTATNKAIPQESQHPLMAAAPYRASRIRSSALNKGGNDAATAANSSNSSNSLNKRSAQPNKKAIVETDVSPSRTPVNKLSMSGMSRMAKMQRIHRKQQQQVVPQTQPKRVSASASADVPKHREENNRNGPLMEARKGETTSAVPSSQKQPLHLRSETTSNHGSELFIQGAVESLLSSEPPNATSSNHRRLAVQPSSSSEYETDASVARRRAQIKYGDRNNSSNNNAGSLETHPATANSYSMTNSTTMDNDDHTVDYGAAAVGGRDDGSQTSLVASQQPQQQPQRGIRSEDLAANRQHMEQIARQKAVAAAKADLTGISQIGNAKSAESATKDPGFSPMAQIAAGVVVAGTIGCTLIGLPGVLVGAAAVGIGVGAMQIPAEQRSNIGSKATVAFKGMQDSCLQASEHMSNACANTYQESGIDEHVPDTVKTCCQSIPGLDDNENNTVLDSNGGAAHGSIGGAAGNDAQPGGPADPTAASAADGILNTSHRTASNVHDTSMSMTMTKEKKTVSPGRNLMMTMNKKAQKVACLRQGEIIPVSQIYALPPTEQPSAWLDVVASAETSHDDKMEALEEIIILAKDRHTSQVLLSEGILDAVMWILGRFFEKSNQEIIPSHWAHPTITTEERSAAILAAVCCVTLGKAHCAAVHTEGNLMLMSRYDRGTVPEERQLAQLLHEVQHYARVTTTNDPTTVLPGSEVFAPKQLSLPQAEELAKSIKELADQR